ncbi:MAG: leucine-rich repeat domain-containing protein [Bryobacteraceae bacterium]
MRIICLIAALTLQGQTALDLTAGWTTDSDLDRVAGMASLERLSLAQTRVTDAGLERLRGLHSLRDLDLYFAEFFTDDGMAALKGLQRLERLNLRGTKVTSRVFEHLSSLGALRSLDISYSQIDDAGVELLAELPQLERLAIGGTRIGVVALSSLKLLPALRHLDVSGMQRVDSGHWGLTLNGMVLGELGTLENLVSLNLSGAILNDIGADKPGLKEEQRQTLEGLEKLAGLKKLEMLDLSRTPVNAAGLRALRGLGNLRELRLALAKNIDDSVVPLLAEWISLRVVTLEGTRVTGDGIERLRAARPDLKLPGPS